jgi:hypothetical protein
MFCDSDLVSNKKRLFYYRVLNDKGERVYQGSIVGTYQVSRNTGKFDFIESFGEPARREIGGVIMAFANHKDFAVSLSDGDSKEIFNANFFLPSA